MKTLLVSNDSMVTKLFGATTKKLGLELIIQKDLENQNLDLDDGFFLFVDEGVNGDFKSFKEKYKPISTCYLHKRSTPTIEGFENDIKKPFLPTEVLNLLKSQLAKLGITEETTSNVTRDELENLSHSNSKDLILDEFEDFKLESLDDFNIDDLDDEATEELPKAQENSEDFEKNLDLDEIFELKDFQEDPNPNAKILPLESQNDETSKSVEMDFDKTENQQDNNKTEKEEESNLSFFDGLNESRLSESDSEYISPQDIDFDLEITKDTQSEDFQEHTKQNFTEEAPENKNENFELSDEKFDVKQIQDEEEFTVASVLDKNQINEVKKLLEDDQEKSLEKLKKVANTNFDGIDAQSMSEALEGISNLDPTNKNSFTLDTDHTNKTMTDAIKSGNLPPSSKQNLSLEKFQELLKNISLEDLKLLLDGMEVTFHINFSKQKDEK